MTNETVKFYNDNADDYAANDVGPNPRLFPFLQRCKTAGKVLELGTGGGFDAAAIINGGFDLDATDGSSELAAIATRRLGRPVRTMLFDELDANDVYDGLKDHDGFKNATVTRNCGFVTFLRRRLTQRLVLQQDIAVDILDIALAAECHGDVEFLLDYFQHPRDAGLAAGAEAVEEGPADIGALGAIGDRLQHVLARADAAVDMDFDLVADRVDHLRQH
jgi:hypothetical protein